MNTLTRIVLGALIALCVLFASGAIAGDSGSLYFNPDGSNSSSLYPEARGFKPSPGSDNYNSWQRRQEKQDRLNEEYQQESLRQQRSAAPADLYKDIAPYNVVTPDGKWMTCSKGFSTTYCY